MFPLNTAQLPARKEDLANLLSNGASTFLRIPTGAYPFKLEGELPEIDGFEVDLDGASLDPSQRPPVPHLTGPESPAFTCRSFNLHAQPLRIGPTPVQVKVEAKSMSFAYRKTQQGSYWLVPSEQQQAADGHVHFQMKQSGIQDVFMTVAAPLSKKYGVTIEDVEVRLEQIGPRSLRAAVHAIGKKFVMRAKLAVMGRLDVDDQLNARISELQASGEGFLGGIVSNLLEPKIAQLNGTTFPLAGLGLGTLQLHHLELAVGTDVVLQAKFG